MNSSEIDIILPIVELKNSSVLCKKNSSRAYASEYKHARKISRVERMSVFSARTSVDWHRSHRNRYIKLVIPWTDTWDELKNGVSPRKYDNHLRFFSIAHLFVHFPLEEYYDLWEEPHICRQICVFWHAFSYDWTI